MPAGLYIHIPFCLHKCPYCDFYSIPYSEDLAQKFVEALRREIDFSKDTSPWSESTFSTLYIGGGTPTILRVSQLREILEQCLSSFRFERGIECTVEVNPETVHEEKLRILRESHVNRLSLGFQSLKDIDLGRLGRIHSVKSARDAYHKARRVGFRNIGIDLIFGIPGQSHAGWVETLHRAVELGPEHISTYNLTVEPGTALAQEMAEGNVSGLSEDQESSMYEYTIDFLEASGYEHYEISNFARPNFRSKHNQLYWDHFPYLGFGPSAHTFYNNWRSERVRDVSEYILRIEHRESTVGGEEFLSKGKLMSEAVFLGLRKRSGLNIDLFRQRFGADVNDLYGDIVKKYVDMQLLERSGSFLRLTRKGLMVANTICAEFM